MNLVKNMIKNKNSKIKADAEKNKKLVADNQKKSKHQNLEEVLEEKSVMKETKTIMLD